MKKMNKEFEELMFTKTEGRMIEQLTVIFFLISYNSDSWAGNKSKNVMNVLSLL